MDANKIVWLSPSPANNTWAIAMRKEVTDANKLVTLSDFGKYVSGGGQVVLAASAEFVNSAAALPALQTTYGFKLKPEQLITLSGGDTAATIAAAANQTSGANAAMVYGTMAASRLPAWSSSRTIRACNRSTSRADHPRSRAEGKS